MHDWIIMHTRMKARITITIDPAVHRRAKRVARARGTSVSGLIESALELATAPAKVSVVEVMIGSGSLRQAPVGGDPLYDALAKKLLTR